MITESKVKVKHVETGEVTEFGLVRSDQGSSGNEVVHRVLAGWVTGTSVSPTTLEDRIDSGMVLYNRRRRTQAATEQIDEAFDVPICTAPGLLERVEELHSGSWPGFEARRAVAFGTGKWFSPSELRGFSLPGVCARQVEPARRAKGRKRKCGIPSAASLLVGSTIPRGPCRGARAGRRACFCRACESTRENAASLVLYN